MIGTIKALIISKGEYKKLSVTERRDADFIAEVDHDDDWLWVHKNEIDGHVGEMHMDILGATLKGLDLYNF